MKYTDNPYWDGARFAPHWRLDGGLAFVNHGSYGACPLRVLEVQAELRAAMEANPMRFFGRELPDALDKARGALAWFVGARPADLAFVPNATAGVNAVLRSLDWKRGDEILITNHIYGACGKAAHYVADRTGARVVTARVPFPLRSADRIVEAVVCQITRRTKFALLDHITSPTALIFPLDELVPLFNARGIPVMIDGAHAPGMVPLNIAKLGVDFYTGNCHKWLCAPKGAGFLWVRDDWQKKIHPLPISHAYGERGGKRSGFHREFDWTGTHDFTPYLCVPAAMEFMGSLLPGGWREVMERNHALTLAARDLLLQALDLPAPCPDELLGSMAAFPGAIFMKRFPRSGMDADPLQRMLWRDYGIEIPFFPWPKAPRRVWRFSAQLYNSLADYERLAAALTAERR
jgi:isopenicillin-N epimerase